MIAVLGQSQDLEPYRNRPGYNVYSGDWTPELGHAWLAEAVSRGDDFLLVSQDFTGQYAQEIRFLQDESARLRQQANALTSRALALEKSIRDVSKIAIDECEE